MFKKHTFLEEKFSKNRGLSNRFKDIKRTMSQIFRDFPSERIKDLSLNTFLDSYGHSHIGRMEEVAKGIIGGFDLNEYETFLLATAFWVHDLGMFVGEESETLDQRIKHNIERGVDQLKRLTNEGKFPLDIESELPTLLDLSFSHRTKHTISFFSERRTVLGKEIRLQLMVSIFRLSHVLDIGQDKPNIAILKDFDIKIPWVIDERQKEDFKIEGVELDFGQGLIEIRFGFSEDVDQRVIQNRIARKIEEVLQHELNCIRSVFSRYQVTLEDVRIRNAATKESLFFPRLGIEQERLGWVMRKYRKELSVKEFPPLTINPIISEDMVVNCWIDLPKVKVFVEKLTDLRFRKNFLLRSEGGTGKTSLLSFLSSKARDGGRDVFWIYPKPDIPTMDGLIYQLMAVSETFPSVILVFDNIEKHPGLINLISEILKVKPDINVWCALEKEGSERIKEEWREVENFIETFEMPGFLSPDDVQIIMDKKFGDILSEKARTMISEEKRDLKMIYFTFLYKNLSENAKAPSNWRETDEMIVNKTSADPVENYKNLYFKLGKFEKFVVEVLCFLNGAKEDLLKEMLEQYGALDPEIVIDSVTLHQLGYRDTLYEFIPQRGEYEIVMMDEKFKWVVDLEMADWDKKNTFPNILLDIAERREKESFKDSLLSLRLKYDDLLSFEEERFVKLILESREEEVSLYIASDLSGQKKELLAIGEDLVKTGEFPHSPHVLFNFGHSFLAQERLDVAILFFKKGIEMSAERSQDFYELGLGHLEIRDYQRAIDYFERSLELDPENTSSMVKIGECYLETGDKEGAIKYFERAVSTDPRSPVVWLRLGKCYAEVSLYAEAIECLRRHASLNKKDFVAWHEMSNYLQEMKKE